MSLIRQIILSLVLVAGAGGGLLFYNHLTAESAVSAGGPAINPVGIEVARARLEVVRDRAEAVGTTLANQAIEIVPLASGRLAELHVEPGQVSRPARCWRGWMTASSAPTWPRPGP